MSGWFRYKFITLQLLLFFTYFSVAEQFKKFKAALELYIWQNNLTEIFLYKYGFNDNNVKLEKPYL